MIFIRPIVGFSITEKIIVVIYFSWFMVLALLRLLGIVRVNLKITRCSNCCIIKMFSRKCLIFIYKGFNSHLMRRPNHFFGFKRTADRRPRYIIEVPLPFKKLMGKQFFVSLKNNKNQYELHFFPGALFLIFPENYRIIKF